MQALAGAASKPSLPVLFMLTQGYFNEATGAPSDCGSDDLAQFALESGGGPAHVGTPPGPRRDVDASDRVVLFDSPAE